MDNEWSERKYGHRINHSNGRAIQPVTVGGGGYNVL